MYLSLDLEFQRPSSVLVGGGDGDCRVVMGKRRYQGEDLGRFPIEKWMMAFVSYLPAVMDSSVCQDVRSVDTGILWLSRLGGCAGSCIGC